MKKGVFAVIVSATFVLAVFLFSGQAFAQNQGQEQKEKKEPTRWGVNASFAPRWDFLESVSKLFDVRELSIDGSDLEIGFLRGKDLSGDWGVSYVRKRLNKNSKIDDTGSFSICGQTQSGKTECFDGGEIWYLKKVVLNGLEIHRYFPFATIKRRVQIGMNFAGGVTWLDGNVEKHDFQPGYTLDPVSKKYFLRQNETVTTVTAKDAFEDAGWPSKDLPLPSAKLELVVAVIAAPGLKVKFSGGLNLPGYQKFSVSVVYFPLTKR